MWSHRPSEWLYAANQVAPTMKACFPVIDYTQHDDFKFTTSIPQIYIWFIELFIQGTSVAISIPLGLFIFKVSYQEAFTDVLQENSAIY